MAIFHDGKLITGRYHGDLALGKKYHDDKLVWQKYSEDARLPKEYQEVEYIESNGKQGITTNIYSNQNTIVKIDFENTLLENNFLVGGRNGQNSKNCFDAFISSNLTVDFADSTARRVMTSISLGRHIVTIDKNKVILDNKSVSFTTSLNNFISEVPLCIAYSKDFLLGDNKPMKGLVGKVYACVVYQGDNCVGNFVPCYRKSDRKAGMYDTITNTFFTSETSTDFSVGENVKCKKLEYIANPNSNFIDLKLKMNSSYSTEIDYQYNKYTVGFLFGSRSSNTDSTIPSSDANMAYSVLLGTTKENFDVCSVFYSTARYQQDYNSDRRKVRINKEGVWIDEVKKKTFNNDSFTTVNSAFMFSCPYCLIGDTKTVGFVDAKVYSLTIKDTSNVLKMNLIPYKINDSIGLLDTVTKVFFSGELLNKPFVTKQSRM